MIKKESKSNHTPGPWRYSVPLDKITTSRIGICESSKQICQDFENVFKDKKEWLANARLVLSAPEMLEMLKLIFNFCDPRDASEQKIFDDAHELVDRIENGVFE